MLLSFFIAKYIKTNVNKVDKTSAIGNENQIPFNPNLIGKKRIKGIRKKPCLDNVNIKAGFALPIAWKYAEPINCIYCLYKGPLVGPFLLTSIGPRFKQNIPDEYSELKDLFISRLLEFQSRIDIL